MRRFLAFAVAVLMVVLGPNLVWLYRSTIYVENRGDSLAEQVSVFACDEEIDLGDMESGETRLELLPQCGDTAVSVTTHLRGAEYQTCNARVEPSMTHVDAWFDSPIKGGCRLGEPLLSPLLLSRLW